MFSTEKGDIFCIVNEGPSNGEVIFIDDTDKNKQGVIRKPVTEISIRGEGEFQFLPDPRIRIIYVCGMSGSGKSTWCANYIEKWKRLNTKKQFFCFSRLDKDPALDYLKPHRVKVDESIIENPLELEDVDKGSLILFDDLDNISNKALQKSVYKFREQVMELGRHRNITLLCTSHLINGNDRAAARTMLNEMQMLVVFPRSGSSYQIRYCLTQYYGMEKKQIKKVLDMGDDSRWVAITKIYPQIVLSSKKAMFVNTLCEDEKTKK